MAAHQAPPSLGFSKQEHWSGLPFPSPMHENDKWKWNCSVVSNPQRPHGLQPSRLLCPWDFPGKSTGVGCQHTYIKSYKYFTSSGRPVSSLLWHRWPRTRKILFLGMPSVCVYHICYYFLFVARVLIFVFTFSAFCGFNWAFHIITFSLLSITVLFFFFYFI